MYSQPKFSVVIPCFNHGSVITKAISSVQAQSVRDWEIVVVDDCSTDDSATKLAALADENQIRVYYNDRNCGPAETRNTAIKHAKGEFVLALDADDSVRPTYFEQALRVFSQQPGVGIVTCGTQFHGSRESVWMPRSGGISEILVDSIPPASIFRRQCWEQANGYDPNICGIEDWDFWIRIVDRGWQIYAIQEILFDFNYSDTGVHARFVEANSKIFESHFKKHEALYSRHMVSTLTALAMKRFDAVQLEMERSAALNSLERLLNRPLIKAVGQLKLAFSGRKPEGQTIGP